MISREFTLEDQLSFAGLSGDFNPMHIDPVSARRFMFGKPVVHGIHTLLWALDQWSADKSEVLHISKLTVKFIKPIGINEKVAFTFEESGESAEITARIKNISVMRLNFDWKSVSGSQSADFGKSPVRIDPIDLSPDELRTARGSLALEMDTALLKELFPSLASMISPLQIVQILTTTRIVGVHCPGLNSVFSELTLQFPDENSADTIEYAARVFDERFNLLILQISSGSMTGSIKAFLRPRPKKQSSSSELAQMAANGEFAGQRAVVIGGSRGLGEVTAKLLAAGGADVQISYYRGKDDAEQICRDAESLPGSIRCFEFNICDENADAAQAVGSDWKPTHLYYFATPFIFDGDRGVFSPELFDRFVRYYVKGFQNSLEKLLPTLTHFYYPSSVAVEELPADMGEYAAAKAAGETLCAFYLKNYPALKGMVPRVPRMDTDQTANFMSVAAHEPSVLMLEHLRALNC